MSDPIKLKPELLGSGGIGMGHYRIFQDPIKGGITVEVKDRGQVRTAEYTPARKKITAFDAGCIADLLKATHRKLQLTITRMLNENEKNNVVHVGKRRPKHRIRRRSPK